MKISEYIEHHLSAAKEGPDKLAQRACVGRASIFRAKLGVDLRLSTVQQIVNAVGTPFVISPENAPLPEVSHDR